MISQSQKADLIATIRKHNPGSALAAALEPLPLSAVEAYLADFAKCHAPQIARVRAGEDPRKVARL
jgi:hypothetical protein